MIDGLSRFLRSENVQLRLVRLVLETTSTASAIVLKAIGNVNQSSIDNMEPKYEQRNGTVHINRVVQSPAMNSTLASKLLPYKEEARELHTDPPLTATVITPGVLNSVGFRTSESFKDECDPMKWLLSCVPSV